MLRRLFETLVLPPASVLVLFLLGTALLRWRKKLGRTLQVLALLWLWLAATPCVGGMLLHSLQSYPALDHTQTVPDVQAIVVLSAGADRIGSEYGGPVIGAMTLQRLRYGIALQRRYRLPLLVSGGKPASHTPTLARMMQQAAEDEFQADVTWLEEASADTRQNAQFSAKILKEQGITKILLVTTAWHMPRAMDCFAAAGIEATAAPTGFRGEVFASWTSFVPHWNGLRDTCLAMHEWGGRVVYAVTN
jgi:uncharacterized SAM-binding protein YcdF (DUF218 family)